MSKPMYWLSAAGILTADVEDDVVPISVGIDCPACPCHGRRDATEPKVGAIDYDAQQYSCYMDTAQHTTRRKHDLPTATCYVDGDHIVVRRHGAESQHLLGRRR